MTHLNDAAFDFDRLVSDIQTECYEIFSCKLKDYGAAWLLFREVSLTDQLWIKIRRIRTLEQTDGNPAVNEGRDSEFIGIINYAIIMLMKLQFPETYPGSDEVIANTSIINNIEHDTMIADYNKIWDKVKALMQNKNHDYGAAWTEMHPFSITDQIITKILRIKNIIKNDGRLLISENIDAQLMDIINYSIFGLIMVRGLI
ncbi:MAG: DUF1599 domain-containing protein [Eubacteriales bacterium]